MISAQHPLRRLIIAAFWLAASPMLLATLGFADSFENDVKLCNSDDVPPEDTISACTRRIESGRLKEGDLAYSYYNRANKWKAKSELDKAIADYNDAIKIAPNYIAALNNRGLTWYTKGDLDRAIADYSEALKINPKYTYSFNNRGNEWRDKGEPDRAIADYNEAIKIDPKYAYA